MLARYSLGRTACVGEFRFDMANETVRVEPSEAFYISLRYRSRATRDDYYVADITVERPPLDTDKALLVPVDSDQTLEWWFRRGQSSVCLSVIGSV